MGTHKHAVVRVWTRYGEGVDTLCGGVDTLCEGVGVYAFVSVMAQMQGNQKISAMTSMKQNFKADGAQRRVALDMMRRIMRRIQNIHKVQGVRNWKEAHQKDKLLQAAMT